MQRLPPSFKAENEFIPDIRLRLLSWWKLILKIWIRNEKGRHTDIKRVGEK